MLAKFLKFELCLLVLGVLGGVGWFIFSTLFAPWDYVGKVPGIPSHIYYFAAQDYGYNKPILIETSRKLAFTCNLVIQVCNPTEDLGPSLRFIGFPDPNLLAPLPPGTVVASTIGMDGELSEFYYRHIVALDDGSIWIWTRGSYDELKPYIWAVIGAAAGGFIGLLIGIFMFWQSLRHESQEKMKNDSKHP